MKGWIHSFESFGSVDGPGIRFVVFMQGCTMRCAFCHNPDTWKTNCGKQFETDEVIKEILKYKNYISDGGVTLSGGEPLLQIDWVIELFTKLKEKNIHTCLDTCGIVFDKSNRTLLNKFNNLIKVCDLVLLDIKHINNLNHIKLTGKENFNVIDFAKFLNKNKVPMWIRYVLCPTINSDEETLIKTHEFISSLSNVKKIEILPYHTMGIKKYTKLNILYKLEGINPPTKEEICLAEKILLKGENF